MPCEWIQRPTYLRHVALWLGQQWVTGSSPFQGHLAGVFRLHSLAVSAVWGVWENSLFSVSMKPSQDVVYSLRPSMTT